MEFNAKAIPQGLKDYNQWVCWRWEKRGEKLLIHPVSPVSPVTPEWCIVYNSITI